MKKSDPFTSDNARIVTDKLTDAQATHHARALFGPTGSVFFKKYFGHDGDWRCGFTSEFGFHLRGQGPTAAAALTAARLARLPDDPGSPPKEPRP